jgi:signal peptidase
MAVLLVGVAALVGTIALPAVAGGTNSYVVLSESMEPTLEPGDVVIVQSTSPSAIEEGDIITYRTTDPVGDAGEDRLTHRVVEKRQTENGTVYQTKGDANDKPDPDLVGHGPDVGKVRFHVPLVGRLILFAQRPLGLAVFVIGPGLLLLASGIRQLITTDAASD